MDDKSTGPQHTPRSLRARLGLLQEKVAELAGVSIPTLAAIEAGSRGTRLSTIEKVAGALQVTTAELITAMDAARAQKGAA